MFLAVKLLDGECIMLINVKMSIIVSILTFMSMINFMRVEHEKSVITSGPGGQANLTYGHAMNHD